MAPGRGAPLGVAPGFCGGEKAQARQNDWSYPLLVQGMMFEQVTIPPFIPPQRHHTHPNVTNLPDPRKSPLQGAGTSSVSFPDSWRAQLPNLPPSSPLWTNGETEAWRSESACARHPVGHAADGRDSRSRVLAEPRTAQNGSRAAHLASWALWDPAERRDSRLLTRRPAGRPCEIPPPHKLRKWESEGVCSLPQREPLHAPRRTLPRAAEKTNRSRVQTCKKSTTHARPLPRTPNTPRKCTLGDKTCHTFYLHAPAQTLSNTSS